MKVAPFEMSKDEIRQELDSIRHPFRLALLRSKNAFNIGSIIRTAHSFLVKEILLVGSEPWYERAAMGMQRYENITEIPTEEEFLARAKAEGWRLVVFEREPARVDLWSAQMGEDVVLVFGNENEGCSRQIIDAANEIVGIPMYGINHSYPVTVAAGIAMAEWARRYAQGRAVVPK